MHKSDTTIYRYESGRIKFGESCTYDISIKKLEVKKTRYGFKTHGGKKIFEEDINKLDKKHLTFYSFNEDNRSEVGLRITLLLAVEDYGITLDDYETLTEDKQIFYLERFEEAVDKTSNSLRSYYTTADKINLLGRLFWCELNREQLEAERKAQEEAERQAAFERERQRQLEHKKWKAEQEKRKKEEAERQALEKELDKKYGPLHVPVWTFGDNNYTLGTISDKSSTINARVYDYNFKVLNGNLYINGLLIYKLDLSMQRGTRSLYLSHNNVYYGTQRLFSAREYAEALREAEYIMRNS